MELTNLVVRLNALVEAAPKSNLNTIYKKYEQNNFYQVNLILAKPFDKTYHKIKVSKDLKMVQLNPDRIDIESLTTVVSCLSLLN